MGQRSMTATRTIGLVDHGRTVTEEEFESAEFEPGYQYEIIDGRVYVLPLPGLPEHSLERWIDFKLQVYAHQCPEVINFVASKPRIYLPGRRRPTAPEPDLAAYHNFPSERSIDQRDWRDVSPVLVVEVLKAADPHKDLVRNVGLYLQVPSIREYWVLDGRDSGDEPTLLVRRRRGADWLRPKATSYGDSYRTPLLPGFTLLIDPRR